MCRDSVSKNCVYEQSHVTQKLIAMQYKEITGLGFHAQTTLNFFLLTINSYYMLSLHY